jgi:RHH-type transcriptional regulator, rel operon repressor / antitoxin RelB
LVTFVTAAEQDDDDLFPHCVIEPVSRPIIYPQFANAFTNRLPVTQLDKSAPCYICIASMEDAMLAVRLNADMERRLDALAEKTGRTKTFYAREAIEAHLDDLEDFYLAEERMKGFRASDAIPLSDVKAQLGLDD